MLGVIASVFSLFVSCGSRPLTPKSQCDDETIKETELPIGYQALRNVEYSELPAEMESEHFFCEIPKYIRNTLRTAPTNAILGIGTARRLTLPVSRSVATIKAREDISRQLEIIARDMVGSYLAASETDPQIALAFLERSDTTWDVRGSSVIDEVMADDGYYWVVVMLSRNNVARIMELHAARLVPGGNAAMWSTERMDAALERNNLAFRAQILVN